MFLEKIRQKNSLMYLKKSVFRDFFEMPASLFFRVFSVFF